MTTLPPNSPRWAVAGLNVAVVVILSLFGIGLKFMGGAFVAGWLGGFFAMYVAVRLKYGFWPFESDH